MRDDFHFLNNFLIIATDYGIIAGQFDGPELTLEHEDFIFLVSFLESINLLVFLKLVFKKYSLTIVFYMIYFPLGVERFF